ncbi:hypothetical protein [Myxosarcina sp. GI1(2024)]
MTNKQRLLKLAKEGGYNSIEEMKSASKAKRREEIDSPLQELFIRVSDRFNSYLTRSPDARPILKDMANTWMKGYEVMIDITALLDDYTAGMMNEKRWEDILPVVVKRVPKAEFEAFIRFHDIVLEGKGVPYIIIALDKRDGAFFYATFELAANFGK